MVLLGVQILNLFLYLDRRFGSHRVHRNFYHKFDDSPPRKHGDVQDMKTQVVLLLMTQADGRYGASIGVRTRGSQCWVIGPDLIEQLFCLSILFSEYCPNNSCGRPKTGGSPSRRCTGPQTYSRFRRQPGAQPHEVEAGGRVQAEGNALHRTGCPGGAELS